MFKMTLKIAKQDRTQPIFTKERAMFFWHIIRQFQVRDTVNN